MIDILVDVRSAADGCLFSASAAAPAMPATPSTIFAKFAG